MTSGNTPNRDHTESLKRLLRRRGRRGKVGANPHTDTTLHAWHSSYSHTPGSSHSSATRWIVVVLVIIFIYALPVAISLMHPLIVDVDPPTLESLLLDVLEMLIRTTIVLAMLLLASILGLIVLSPVMWFWKQLDGDNPAVRERLIARADRIIAKRQAKGANSHAALSQTRQETEA